MRLNVLLEGVGGGVYARSDGGVKAAVRLSCAWKGRYGVSWWTFVVGGAARTAVRLLWSG